MRSVGASDQGVAPHGAEGLRGRARAAHVPSQGNDLTEWPARTFGIPDATDAIFRLFTQGPDVCGKSG